MNGRLQRSVVVVGGGATGVILAANLARFSDNVRVAVVEKSGEFGRGLAYSTRLADHRLNVRADMMGAFSQDTRGFWSWIKAEKLVTHDYAHSFLPRDLYGRYLSALFDDIRALPGGQVRGIADECIDINTTSSGVEVLLASGVSLPAHAAILAVGHDPNPAPEQAFGQRLSGRKADIDPNGRIVILGSGLSMIDAWLSLEHQGHRGQVIVISRRGLLPQAHVALRNPLHLDSADVPLGTELSYFVRWFGELVEETKRAGGDWRDVIDGLRPFNQRIWREWPLSARRRFLEHTKAWWDIHRHRLAPDVRARAEEAIAEGRLKLVAAKVLEASHNEAGQTTLTVRPRNRTETDTIVADHVIDCTGVAKDITRSSLPLLQKLFAKGLIRPDPLRLGIDVTANCAAVDRTGAASTKLFAIGPVTRGAFFEIDAIPEIREQCAALASQLSGEISISRSA
jgi:uncharacterized NAD(P)/FAD-binding protein YdhS